MSSQNPANDSFCLMNLEISHIPADDLTVQHRYQKSSASANQLGQVSPMNVQNDFAPYNHSTAQPAQVGGIYISDLTEARSS